MSNEFTEIMRQYKSFEKPVFNIALFNKKIKTFKHTLYGDITSKNLKLSLTMNLNDDGVGSIHLILKLSTTSIDSEQPILQYERVFKKHYGHKYLYKDMIALLIDGLSKQRATDILTDLDEVDLLLREQKELVFENHDCGICYRETRTTINCCNACVCLICLAQVRGLCCPFCRFEFENDVFEVSTGSVDEE